MVTRLARLTSNVLNPFLVSLAVMALLAFATTTSTAAALKWALAAAALSVLPVFVAVIILVRRRHLDGVFINPRQQRYKVYLPSTVMGAVSCLVLYYAGAPRPMVATFVAGLVAIVIYMGINFFWKISLHTAFAAAAVTVVALVYGYPALPAAALLLAVAWSRLHLKLHSPAQVAGGAVLAPAIVLAVFRSFGLLGT